MTEEFTHFKHPPMFEINECKLPSEEVNRRLKIFFDALPRLWIDYAAAVLPYRDLHVLEADVMANILNRLSLRPDQFLEWDTDYFNHHLEDNIKIARERGSHDTYG